MATRLRRSWLSLAAIASVYFGCLLGLALLGQWLSERAG